jgi:hypothetical protein
MEFVVVNGRTPRPQAFCASWCVPIGESCPRDLATDPSHCDRECFVAHCEVAVPAPRKHARAS